jgi:hypothetical protein
MTFSAPMLEPRSSNIGQHPLVYGWHGKGYYHTNRVINKYSPHGKLLRTRLHHLHLSMAIPRSPQPYLHRNLHSKSFPLASLHPLNKIVDGHQKPRARNLNFAIPFAVTGDKSIPAESWTWKQLSIATVIQKFLRVTALHRETVIRLIVMTV